MRQLGSRLSGVRTRSLLLIALIVLPLLGVTVYSYTRELSAARENAHVRALDIAVLARHEYQQRVDAARQLITPDFPFSGGQAMALVAADRGRCDRAFADMLRQNTGYANLFVVNLNGDLVCTAVPAPGPVSVTDRDYFQEAVRTLAPAVGAPTIGRVSNIPSVVVGYPILDDQRRLVGIAGASLDLDAIVRLPEAVQLPPGSSVTIVDQQGIVLARNIDPDRWVGKPGPRLAGLAGVGDRGGIAHGTGTDGVERLYGMLPLRPFPNGPTQGTLLVGIPARVAYSAADEDFRRNLLWLAATTAIAAMAAWVSAERLVVSPLRLITGATQRIARGEFGTRTGLGGSAGEIGMLASAVDSMGRDLMTSRAQMESDRQEMASVLSSVPNVIALVDEEGKVIRVNAAIERLFGQTPAESVGLNIHTLFDEPVLPAIDGDSALHPLESTGHHRDGTTFPIEVIIREVAGSRPRRLVVILRDLTERKRAEADRELARVAESRADFLRTLSHELRSPLTAVLGFGQLLETELTDPGQRQQVHGIMDAGGHMLALVNDLLDLSRIDAGRWDVHYEPVDLNDLLRTIVEGFEPLAAGKGLRLASVLPTEPVMIATDKRSLREILTNLIENAVKFTDRGTVEMRVGQRDAWIEIRVSDTGVGIPPEQIESIFAEFVQLRSASSGARNGSGLGLAITRRLVSLLGGQLEIASTPGAGSTFTVRLPLMHGGGAS